MGCDIHMGIEVRDGGVWRICRTHLLPPDEWHTGDLFDQYPDRSYQLFGALAEGVRRDVPSVGPSRGVPADSSDEYKALVEEWGIDGHSHSWCTLKECLDFTGWPEDPVWYSLLECASDLGEAEDVRFVYFFDN